VTISFSKKDSALWRSLVSYLGTNNAYIWNESSITKARGSVVLQEDVQLEDQERDGRKKF